IRPEDGPQHRAFAAQLAPEDIRLRFFYTRRELPKSELARLTQIDYDREMAFVAVRPGPGGGEETLGVVRGVCDPDNVEAEFAVLVRSDLKRHGLGHLLLSRLVDYLTSRGTQRIVGYVLPENLAMRDLALREGFILDAAGSDSEAQRWVRELQ
ncbi:MAG: GNAT family N-acetyltransferase, partial [Caldimonas sp.]